MKREIEIYAAKLYTNPNGWWFSILEIQNFDNGENWCLLSISRRNKASATSGWELRWCS